MKEQSNKGGIIFVISLIVLIGGGVAYSLLFSNNEPTESSTTNQEESGNFFSEFWKGLTDSFTPCDSSKDPSCGETDTTDIADDHRIPIFLKTIYSPEANKYYTLYYNDDPYARYNEKMSPHDSTQPFKNKGYDPIEYNYQGPTITLFSENSGNHKKELLYTIPTYIYQGQIDLQQFGNVIWIIGDNDEKTYPLLFMYDPQTKTLNNINSFKSEHPEIKDSIYEIRLFGEKGRRPYLEITTTQGDEFEYSLNDGKLLTENDNIREIYKETRDRLTLDDDTKSPLRKVSIPLYYRNVSDRDGEALQTSFLKGGILGQDKENAVILSKENLSPETKHKLTLVDINGNILWEKPQKEREESLGLPKDYEFRDPLYRDGIKADIYDDKIILNYPEYGRLILNKENGNIMK